jgi:ubiquinone/menaquinone biosynthesis C-methylase UbiE
MAKSWEYYDEIASKYDYMYEEPYWKLYHALTEKLIEDFIKKEDLKDLTVLDLGSGTGRWAIYFADNGAKKVYAYDPSVKMLEVAEMKAKEWGLDDKIKFILGVAEKMPFDSECFDVVNAQGDVLSYVQDLESAMKEINRVLKKDGLLIGSVDSYYMFLNDMVSNVDLGELKKFEKNKKALIGDLSVSKKLFPTRTFSVEDIKNLESYGFELLDIAGKVVFSPYVEKKLARYLEKVLEIEHRYCRVKELIGRSEHIHFVLKKVQ